MNREEAKKFLAIIQAFAESKKVEQKIEGLTNWHEVDDDLDISSITKHRIKPKIKCRPFKTQEECWNEMHKHSDFGWVIRSGVYLNISGVYCDTIYTLEDGNGIHFDYAFEELTFTDGTPFGVNEE